MSEEKQFSQPPPDDDAEVFRKIMWLCAALFPSLIGFACLHMKPSGQSLLLLLVAVDLICSVAGSIGLVRRMKSAASQVFWGFFFSLFFFVLNALIVLFMGCSGMGRIAP
jgi:hypothetical protein